MTDILDEHSQDAAELTAYVAAANAHTLTIKDGAQRLTALLVGLAKATLALRDVVIQARAQARELAQIWVGVRGLANVCAMHYVYNKLAGLDDAPAHALSDAANALLATCGNSSVYLDAHGDLCKPNVLVVNSQVRRDLAALVGDISHALKDPDLLDAYNTWFGAELAAASTDTPYEARVANIVIADAIQVMHEAGAHVDPKDSSGAQVSEIMQMVEDLAATSIDTLRSNPGTGTIIDAAMPTWGRLMLATAANVGGLMSPGVGPDHLLLKIAILYCNQTIPKIAADPAKVQDFRTRVLPKLIEATGLDKAEATKQFEAILAAGGKLSEARVKLAFATSAVGTQGRPSDDELVQIKASEAAASSAMDDATKSFKDDYLDKNVHFHDGPVANGVVAVLSALQLADAVISFHQASGLAEVKAGADMAGAAAQLAGAAPYVLVRLDLIDSSSVFVKTLDSVRPVLGGAVAVASLLSGALQMAMGLEKGGKSSDVVVGALNVVYGGSFLLYATACETWFVLPVVGQVAGLLAFSIGVSLAVGDLLTLMTERYVTSSLDTLAKAQWAHGDVSDQKLVSEMLGIKEALDAVAYAAANVRFSRILVPPGMSRAQIVDGLSFYVGASAADEMVAFYGGTPQ